MTDRLARHPNLAAWAVLAGGMLAILAWSARDVGLNARQWLALAVATVALAGLCAWIISWEADVEDATVDAAIEAVPAEVAGPDGDGVHAADVDAQRAVMNGEGSTDAEPT